MVDLRSYILVTAAYWGFTLTDGALRMLVLLHFHELGFNPVELAFLFLLYEFFGIVTNLVGGWIGSRFGLKITLFAGLAIQIVALVMLSLIQPAWVAWLSVAYVMVAQALSGIAKDLTKMSSKSAVKLVVPGDSESLLFKWVAILTGSKNALKGLGFFIGGAGLGLIGFAPSLWVMALGLAFVLLFSVLSLKQDMGRSKVKTKFKQIFSKSREINILSLARFFLFSSRDVWFVVGLPIFLYEGLGWTFTGVGAFMAAWVIGYGFVQAAAPRFLRQSTGEAVGTTAARAWAFGLAVIPAGIALAMVLDFYPVAAVLGGLILFGIVFAVNSSLHSYLILACTDADQVALNVGFYYMANACGRLVGTLLSGVMYLAAGLVGCLWVSAVMVLAAAALTLTLPMFQARLDDQTGVTKGEG
ncbi:MAG: organoarsenical effux MFS transporter ArsJ [Phycisphaeraceae bacterium]